MIIQSILNLVNICWEKRVRDVVISPGSRSAPLTLAFVRHGGFKSFIAGDERSAGFLALGIAQAQRKPVALVCTSGTAAYNYAPSVAEAYYQEIPLIVLTSDRPPEWIDQKDGQTIRQNNLYHDHVKKSYTLAADLSTPEINWQVERSISEAINLANTYPEGPIHINIPFREPFYPSPGEQFNYKAPYKCIDLWTGESNFSIQDWQKLATEIKSFDRIMVIAGQDNPNPELKDLLNEISDQMNWVVLGDTIANLNCKVRSHDIFFSSESNRQNSNLAPDLLITFGKSVLSKGLKQFLRINKPRSHWHLAPTSIVADPFQSLTRILSLSPVTFFINLKKNAAEKLKKQNSYSNTFSKLEKTALSLINQFAYEEFSEFEAVKVVLEHLGSNVDLHLANSMPVRYVNLLNALMPTGIDIYSNRGTSGIDGSTSTALGHAMVKKRLQILLTGDMAFFYDRNAFWQRKVPENFRVILFNNHGGGIFHLIDGPSQLKEAGEYFVTENRLNGRGLAEENDMEYYFCDQRSKLKEYLGSFFQQSSQPRLLEIDTKHENNIQTFKSFKNLILKNYES